MKKTFYFVLFIFSSIIFKAQAYSTVTGNCIYFDFQRLPGGNGFTGNYYDAPTFNWIDNITPKSGMYITNQTGTGVNDSNGTTTGVGQKNAYSAAGSSGVTPNVYSGMPSGALALTLNTPLPSSYGGTNTKTGPSTGLVYDHRYYIPISSGAGDFTFVSSVNGFNIGTNASLYAIINNKTTLTGGVMFRVYTTNDIFSGVANSYYDAFLPPNTTTSVAFIIPNATIIKGMGVSFTNIVGNVDIKLINVFNAGFTVTNPACITTASSTGITFTNNPTGSITGCYWDFGPGAIPATTITSGLNYPTVVFTSSGIKSINLTVTGFVTKTFTGIITISGPSLVGGISSTANTTCVNSAIVVSVAGTNGTIQWENSLNSSIYNSITGANASTYTTTLGTSMYYRARVTNGGCQTLSGSQLITINSILGVSYNYNSNLPICATVNTIQANLTVGGIPALSYFSTSVTGLLIDPVNGVLTIPGTVQGVFATNYVNSVPGCALSTITSLVTINSIPGINNFSYGGPVCATALTKSPTTITGTVSGGYFTTTVIGVTLNSLSGVWTFASTDQGNFWAVYNRSVVGCGIVSSAAGITINSILGVSYNYNSNLPICATVNTIQPNLTVSGTPVSSYFSISVTGLRIDPVNGVLTIPGTVQGVFATNYVNSVPGCALSTTTSLVTINSIPGINNFSYSGPVCATALTKSITTITGTVAGGYFTTTAIGVTINSLTGVWTFASTDQGNFWAVYNRSVVGCGLVSSAAGITINSILGVSYNYNNSLSICATDINAIPNITVSGTPVLSYYSLTATGFKVGSITGILTFPGTVQGVFAVNYVNSVPGCALSTTTSLVTINSIPGINNFSYGGPVCATALTKSITTITGTVAGGYFTTTAIGVTLNSLTGVWTFASTDQGNFWAVYNRSVVGCGLVSSAAGITINSILGVSYNYNNSLSICATDINAIPNITVSGTPVLSYYSLTATGFKVGSITGILTFPGTVQGVFATNYVNSVPGCALSTTTSIVTINSVPGITYSYPVAVCATVLTAQPAITGTIAGGYFTTTATGLTINSVTGVWTFTSTVQGNFWAQYSRSIAGCGLVSSTAGITINSVLGVSYDYNSTLAICATDGSAIPNLTLTGTPVSSYYSLTATGFKINSVTGVLIFPYTVQGVFAAKYINSVPGCALSTTTSIVTINSVPGINYSYAYAVCATVLTAQPAITGTIAGGYFTTTATGLILNSLTGVWTFANTDQGVFWAQYNRSIAGCGIVSSAAGITINSIPGISYDYNSNIPLCSTVNTAQPNLTVGGTFVRSYFTLTTTGFKVNSVTGVLSFPYTVQGVFAPKYVISVPGCVLITTTSIVTINSIPGMNYSYSTPVCSNSSPRQIISVTGFFKPGGYYTTTATGLTLNTNTGAWSFGAGVQGTFVNQYNVSIPGCGIVTSSAGITINSVPGIFFNYSSPVCARDGSATPNITSIPPGGFFSKTSPLISLNSLTGVLTFAGTVQNTFNIRYNISVPGCGTIITTVGITINTYQSPSYTYPSPVCATSGSAAPVISGSFTGGAFSSTTPGITIDPTTGVLTFANTVQGDFEGIYQTSIPGCGNIVTTAGITINSVPGISYSYPGPVCVTTGTASPAITGTLSGGSFSTTASGLNIDVNTGVLSFSPSIPPGNYSGQYNISVPGCGIISVSGALKLNSIPELPFSYPSPVCAADRFKAPDLSLLQGGGRFSAVSSGIAVNDFTGVISFDSTAQGSFSSKYTILIPGCGLVSSTAGITVNSIPGISYSYSDTCASSGHALPKISSLIPGGYFNTTATGLTIDPTSGEWTFANTVEGTYVGKYNFSVVGCGLISSAASVTIHQTLNASVTITTAQDTICDGENALFTATGVNVGSDPLYSWMVNSSVFPSQSQFFSTINLKDKDNVSVVLTSNLKCLAQKTASSETITFVVTPSKFNIPIVITGGGDVCEGDNLNYSVDPISGASFVWTIPGEGSFISGQGTNSISVLYNTVPAKVSYVSVIASNQCAVSDIIKKQVIASTTCIPAFKITNLITPNSGDENSTWHIIGIEKYPNAEIKIYTSWGDLVFETKSYNNNTNAWNGKYNGNSVSTATYYYTIDLKNGSKIKAGYLTVRE